MVTLLVTEIVGILSKSGASLAVRRILRGCIASVLGSSKWLVFWHHATTPFPDSANCLLFHTGGMSGELLLVAHLAFAQQRIRGIRPSFTSGALEAV